MCQQCTMLLVNACGYEEFFAALLGPVENAECFFWIVSGCRALGQIFQEWLLSLLMIQLEKPKSIPNYSYCLRKPYANRANFKLNKIRNFLYLSTFLCYFVYKYTYSIILRARNHTAKDGIGIIACQFNLAIYKTYYGLSPQWASLC